MSEKLIIRNFGPITNVELDLRKVNVLIGDQGTGKSTVAKVLWVLKNTAYHHVGEISIKIGNREVTDEVEIQVYRNKQFNDEFYDNIEKIELKSYFYEKPYIFFENSFCKIELKDTILFFLAKKSVEKHTDQNHFIPANRDAYILLKDKYPALSIVGAKLPLLVDYFGLRFNKSREKLRNFDFKDILNINYEFVNGFDKIVLESGKEITFEESSSAINSVVPMLVVFEAVINEMSDDSFRILYKDNCPFVTIEEPELNCYPSTQKRLIEFLIEKIKFKNKHKQTNEYYCNLLLTTHSPYILSTLNNLMFAYKTGLEHHDEVDKIIPSKYWLNPKDVSAYRLNEGGVSEEIIDKEGLIKTSKIDEASSILNTEFNKVFDLEFSVAK